VRIVLLGPPGAGKGTQAYRLATRYSIPLISTGDIFRRNVEEHSELGAKAKKYMDAGELVPDGVVVDMVMAGLEQTPKGFVLDGFPRTIVQAEKLEDSTIEKGFPITAALFLAVDDELAVKRIAGRRTCAICQRPYNVELSPPREDDICDRCGGRLTAREDDHEDTVRHRLEVYHAQTQPLLAFYAERGLLREIDADAFPDDVTDRAMSALAKARPA
jgi:adenylate kinase